jgi:DNA polymerase I-like protein with 3'-5' exonuclease and polymerase domains
VVDGLKLKDGSPLKEHLKKNGIKFYSEFEGHVQDVENHFWKVKFKAYDAWREEALLEYERKGFADFLTGFRCQGPLLRNEIWNYPVQGAAFHLLLWSLITIQKWLEEEQLDSCIIGEIHDSLLFDFIPEERDYVLCNAKRIMTQEIRKQFPWIIVPLEVEAEVAPVDCPWSEKKVIEILDDATRK